MKLTIFAYLDVGESIGIDDTPLSNQTALDSLAQATGIPVCAPGLELPVGVSLPIGRGIRLDLSATSVGAALHREAITRAQSSFESRSKQDGDQPDIGAALAALPAPVISLTYFSIGICLVQIDIHNVPNQYAARIVEVYQFFEYSGYGEFSRQLRHYLELIQKHLGSHDEILAMSRRRRLEDISDFDLIPGFLCVVTTTPEEDVATIIDVSQEYERQYQFKLLELDDATLHLGWACAVLCPRSPDADIERILFLIGVSQVYFGINEAFEQLFAKRMTESLRANLGDASIHFDARQLNSLRTMATVIVENTSLSSSSNNISDLCFFEAFSDLSKIDEKRDRIRRTSEVFDSMQRELILQAESSRERNLNRFVFFLTSLTFVSVTADIINTVDYVQRLVPNPVHRGVFLALPPLLAIVWIWRAYFRGKRG